MRDIIAVCRSSGKARQHVAHVLDAYLFRIGDKTWRGKASNACLDRIARDLRKRATRATAVSVHGFHKSQESPLLFRVGSAARFGADGIAPIKHHGTRGGARRARSGTEETLRAMVRIAAHFHDLGKATQLFQAKLADALAGAPAQADALRHELVSALAWDEIFPPGLDGGSARDVLCALTPAGIDAAMAKAARRGTELFALASRAAEGVPIDFRFLRGPALLSGIGLLILGHHRLPMLGSTGKAPTTELHCNTKSELKAGDLLVAPGTPYWHEPGWIEALREDVGKVSDPDAVLAVLDLQGRSALMFADHYGSAQKVPSRTVTQLANTLRTEAGGIVAADSLAMHVRRVTTACRASFDALVACREAYPALDIETTPTSLLSMDMTGRFAWQGQSAAVAAQLAASGDGGFFACLMAGTGTGKTRAAPGVLAAACFSDVDPARRRLRFTLGLGLRTLATQSGREYVEDIGFSTRDVSVLVGTPPLAFREDDGGRAESSGSEDRLTALEAVRVIEAGGDIPPAGSEREADWLSGLSFDPSAEPPAFIGLLAGQDHRGATLKNLAAAPVLSATVDHVIAAASPERSRHLAAVVRIVSSDFILDEVDQYGPEDLSVVARLCYLIGLAGRRLVVMSATITREIATTLHDAYRKGWSAHAAAFGRRDHVHSLCASDRDGAIASSLEVQSFAEGFDRVAGKTEEAIRALDAKRLATVLPDVPLTELPDLLGRSCSGLHDGNHVLLEGFRVSMGFIKMTRVGHTAAMAAALPPAPGRLRVVCCLHSRFSRLLRSWIERRLKAALTRKGKDPDAGLRQLCRQEGLFEEAARRGVSDIEIVLVCSPVIETGNDLDFDWAILDPTSTRSVVQAAGRVMRHRTLTLRGPNLALLARPMVVQESKVLAMPGVETAPHAQTTVTRLDLKRFGAEDRATRTLLGLDSPISPVDGRMINGSGADAPLPRAEAEAVHRFLHGTGAPLFDWTDEVLQRHGARQSRRRRFRRSTQSTIRAWQEGEIGSLRWFWDRMPGSRDRIIEPAVNIGTAPPLAAPLFRDILRRAWAAYSSEDDVSRRAGELALGIDWDIHDRMEDPDLVFSDDLGLFRRSALTLF